jgi:hypothetical protein
LFRISEHLVLVLNTFRSKQTSGSGVLANFQRTDNLIKELAVSGRFFDLLLQVFRTPIKLRVKTGVIMF